MRKTRTHHNDTLDTRETRLAAAQTFVLGDRVRNRVTGKRGNFVGINLGFALPEVWVEFDSDTESSVPVSCNPLDLELVTNSKCNEIEELPLVTELSEPKQVVIVQEHPVTAVEVVEELTESEVVDRHRLELKVERAFYDAGCALRELRERRLYRSTHRTFEHYCQERFGFNRMAAHLKIAAATVFENLYTNGIQTLPTSERQVRSITSLEPDEQRQVWNEAVESSGGKVPTGRIVKGIVEQLKQKPLTKATDFCQKGDVFTLIGLEGRERKYRSCWAIALSVNDFTVEVDVYDATLTVKPDNLNRIDSPDVQRQLPHILRRIKRLRQYDLDRGAYPILESLGRQTYLTDLEAKLLTFLEQQYESE